MTIKDCPSRLYKYMPPERVDALENAQLRYSPLGAFNDPFEGRPNIPSIATDEETLEMFQKIIPDEAKRGYEQLPAQVRSVLSFEQYALLFICLAQDRQSEIMQGIQAFTSPFTQFVHQKLDMLLGALCLAEIADSILMWAHYAGSHTGYALEFDGHHAHFHEQRSPEDAFRHVRRVTYQETRPSATFSELDPSSLLLVKSSHWAYEKEWRIFRALADAQTVFPGTPYPVHLFGFPRQAVKSVILGVRIAPETEARIRAVLRSHPDYNDIVLKRVRIDEAQFSMRVEAAS